MPKNPGCRKEVICMKHMSAFALKGNICFSQGKNKISVHEQSYLICENGVCAGIFKELPEGFLHIPVRDAGDSLIIPGLSDIHLHAPQYSFRGMGTDWEFLDRRTLLLSRKNPNTQIRNMPEKPILFLQKT